MKDNNFFTELLPLGLIQVSGADAEKFLQGQLTCDVKTAAQQQSCLGAHCDPKGRVQATLRLFHLQNNYYLQLPKDTLASLLKSLTKYAVFSKVKLEDVSHAWRQLGIYGPDGAAILNKITDQTLPCADNAITYDEIIILRLSDTLPRFCLLGDNAKMQIITQQLSDYCQHTSYSAWELLDIIHGVPTISSATSGLFTPQQINYTALGGVSFTKGCYIGQEIIARTHYLGKVKQQMYGVTFKCETAPAPGMRIYNQEKQECGALMQAAATLENTWRGIAVILNDAIQQPLYIENTGNRVLRIDNFTYTSV